MKYRTRKDFAIRVGFEVRHTHIHKATQLTNRILADLPASLYRSLDFKTVSSIVGSIFCDTLANETNGIVNPIEKGHPDLVPATAAQATEVELRNYPEGLEVTCTVGNIEQGANLRAGQQRVDRLTGITWQAHHREVSSLMGLSWDFANLSDSFNFPAITGVFYTANLVEDDWGAVSGTTGRNTKVSGMRASGKAKMAGGWVLLLDDAAYISRFSRLLGTPE
ncbi:hypothetical protein [Xanthomonas translucens]|uniref:hypothetical protein n=1 Tax=Xanthomonas campestris pv. translucens TaxID=343 RepID=UPI00200A1BDA|nr:hypothetical protein [Xanthomonas translucens]UPU49552.1 hypothetical protein MZO50_03525 [Xanthomonas translucens pv. undulosa]